MFLALLFLLLWCDVTSLFSVLSEINKYINSRLHLYTFAKFKDTGRCMFIFLDFFTNWITGEVKG